MSIFFQKKFNRCARYFVDQLGQEVVTAQAATDESTPPDMPMTTFLGFIGEIEEELGWLIKKMREYFINW